MSKQYLINLTLLAQAVCGNTITNDNYHNTPAESHISTTHSYESNHVILPERCKSQNHIQSQNDVACANDRQIKAWLNAENNVEYATNLSYALAINSDQSSAYTPTQAQESKICSNAISVSTEDTPLSNLYAHKAPMSDLAILPNLARVPMPDLETLSDSEYSDTATIPQSPPQTPRDQIMDTSTYSSTPPMTPSDQLILTGLTRNLETYEMSYTPEAPRKTSTSNSHCNIAMNCSSNGDTVSAPYSLSHNQYIAWSDLQPYMYESSESPSTPSHQITSVLNNQTPWAPQRQTHFVPAVSSAVTTQLNMDDDISEPTTPRNQMSVPQNVSPQSTNRMVKIWFLR